MPWREAGLDERRAAAHLLDRFAFGARPGDVDRVVEIGLERWLELQLEGARPEPGELRRRLARLNSQEMDAREMVRTYPSAGMLRREAQMNGDSMDRDAVDVEEMDEDDRRRHRRQLYAYALERGYRPLRELLGETMAAKLYRAVYAENQLTETLVDFWFNHFNVSLADGETRPFIASYERDAIRPHVLGDFRTLLEATARHPAMLLYLDNARSGAAEGAPTTVDHARLHFEGRSGGRFGSRGARGGFGRRGPDRPQGLNENYARELLELHTLGVDGGYDQDDVVEVARAFTGWTAYPPGPKGEELDRRRRQRGDFFRRAGFVTDGFFLFRADVHDAGEKTILGRAYAAGRGLEDGLEVLDALAAHPSTARHLATKLARRFVADEPPEALVERLATRYLATGGDLRQVLSALAESPEFWSPEALEQKIKSPFELAASALRALDAELGDPRAVVEWLERMGQPLYAYQAPTGYPDRATAWVNTGALLQRMNFGLQLATGRIAGVELDLLALNGGREPESLAAALHAYVPLLLPERDPSSTVARLEPMVLDPELSDKVERAAPAAEPAFDDDLDDDWRPERRRQRAGRFGRPPRPPIEPDSRPLAHVVGVILGSPEFQRR